MVCLHTIVIQYSSMCVLGKEGGAVGNETLMQILKNCVKTAHFGTFWDNFSHLAPCKHSKPPETNPQHASIKHIF